MQVLEQQHQQLIILLHDLNEAVQRWESRTVVYQLIDALIVSTCKHFDAEEQLMQLCAFPDLNGHREMHRQLVQDMLRLKGKLDYLGEPMFSEWFTHWPLARVVAHIQYADKQLEAHISAYPIRQ